MRWKPGSVLPLAALALAVGGGCRRPAEGAGVVGAPLQARCSLDAGPCDPRATAALRLDLTTFRGLATGPRGAVYVSGALAPPTRTFDGTSLTAAGGLDIFVGKYEVDTGRAAWVKRLGDGALQEPTGLAVTPDQTVVVAGRFTGTLEAEGIKVTSPTSSGADLLLGLSGSDGTLRWAQAFDDGPESVLAAVGASTQLDRVAACGSATQAATGLVPGARFLGGSRDALVALFDATGRRLWSRQLGGSGNEECLAVAVDGAGDVYAAGRYNRAFSLEGPLPEPGGGYTYWIWVAKLDGRSGQVLAQAAFGGPVGVQRPTALAVDAAGQVLLAGDMNAALELGGDGGTLDSAGYVDGFVAKLDPVASPAFAPRWAVRLGGPSVDGTKSVAIDPYGDVAVAGFFIHRTTGAAVLAGQAPGSDAFLLLLDGATGATRSAQAFGDPDTQTAERVAFGRDRAGRPFLALGGEFTGTVAFEGTAPLATAGGATFLMFAR